MSAIDKILNQIEVDLLKYNLTDKEVHELYKMFNKAVNLAELAGFEHGKVVGALQLYNDVNNFDFEEEIKKDSGEEVLIKRN